MNSPIKVLTRRRFELKELDLNLVDDNLYEMYQDIPHGDNGQSNLAYGIDRAEFAQYIQAQINRKNNEVTYDDTPTTTFILYVDGLPVGYICLRTETDENWMKWSGNFYYAIRVSERRKGYATKMLELGLLELKKMGFTEAFGQSSAGNVGSAKVIENNSGEFLREDDGTRYYRIKL